MGVKSVEARWTIATRTKAARPPAEETAAPKDIPSQPRPQQRHDQTTRKAAAQRFALASAKLAADTRCHQVVVLDVAGLSPLADFFVIASGTSARQMRTVADELSEVAQQNGYPSRGSSRYEGESWILLDCVDVVIHIFNTEARGYYDLDSLWGDAKRVEWEQEIAQ